MLSDIEIATDEYNTQSQWAALKHILEWPIIHTEDTRKGQKCVVTKSICMSKCCLTLKSQLMNTQMQLWATQKHILEWPKIHIKDNRKGQKCLVTEGIYMSRLRIAWQGEFLCHKAWFRIWYCDLLLKVSLWLLEAFAGHNCPWHGTPASLVTPWHQSYSITHTRGVKNKVDICSKVCLCKTHLASFNGEANRRLSFSR